MQVDEKTFVVNSGVAVIACCQWITRMFSEHKFVTFTMRIGPDRSLDQNSLLHVWLTEYAAFLLSKPKKAVTDGELEGIKKLAKKKYYAETGFDWLLVTPVDPWTGAHGKPVLRSSADYRRGEMFLFLTWLQNMAANDGLVLESRGEYAKLQRAA